MRCGTTRARSGITLTEILISIMILGVGMVSLATLFPIGLLRLRDAQRNNRSTLLYYSAGNDIQARDLFNAASFPSSWYGASIPGVSPATPSAFGAYDPWVSDPAGPLARTGGQPGLPVMYDPLWWSVILKQVDGQAANGNLTSTTAIPASNAARFGFSSALPADPSGGLAASSAGLQRLTNFITLGDPSLFVSQDDIETMSTGPSSNNSPPTATAPGSYTFGSPVLPALYLNANNAVPPGGALLNDWSYSWAFTGYRVIATEFTTYVGSIVVFNNRPFALDAGGVPAGERTVEGVFAYGLASGTNTFSTGDPRVVLLRWPNTQPDPDIAVGSWLADVTYEGNAANSTTKTNNTPSPGPMQRCYWYRVARRGVPGPDADATNYSTSRSMTVTLASPVVQKTLLQAGTNIPAFTNAALLCPSVVNVIPKVIYSR